VLHVLGNRGRLAPERGHVVSVRVVGVARGEVPDRRLALDVDEVLVVVHLEAGFSGLNHPPDHNRCDLDGIPSMSFTLRRWLSKFLMRWETRRFE